MQMIQTTPVFSTIVLSAVPVIFLSFSVPQYFLHCPADNRCIALSYSGDQLKTMHLF